MKSILGKHWQSKVETKTLRQYHEYITFPKLLKETFNIYCKQKYVLLKFVFEQKYQNFKTIGQAFCNGEE